jgi:hypothetical protein
MTSSYIRLALFILFCTFILIGVTGVFGIILLMLFAAPVLFILALL